MCSLFVALSCHPITFEKATKVCKNGQMLDYTVEITALYTKQCVPFVSNFSLPFLFCSIKKEDIVNITKVFPCSLARFVESFTVFICNIKLLCMEGSPDTTCIHVYVISCLPCLHSLSLNWKSHLTIFMMGTSSSFEWPLSRQREYLANSLTSSSSSGKTCSQ